jgi:hypothetical protein
MKLIYRGTTYNYDPDRVKTRHPFPRTGSTYKLIYRGSTYRFDPTRARLATVKPNRYKLIYRGSTYQMHQNEKGQVSHKSTSH